jgi:hypothetical protein
MSQVVRPTAPSLFAESNLLRRRAHAGVLCTAKIDIAWTGATAQDCLVDLNFNPSPESTSQILLRWGFHFGIGLFMSLPIAAAAFVLVGMAPNVNLVKAAALIVLLISAPIGIVAWLIGLIRRGEVLYWLISLLGIKVTNWP